MATIPKFPPIPHPMVGPDGRITVPWAQYFQGLTGQAAAAGTGTVTNVSGTSPIASSGGATPAISLATSGVSAGSYGDATHVGAFTVDAYGRLTAASNVAISGGGSSFWTDVIASADEDVTSSTTVQADDELFFTMVAASVYLWDLYLVYGSPSGGGTPDMKIQFAGPATFTGQGSYLGYITTADALNGALGQQDINTAPFLTPGTATTPRLARVTGWAYSTAGGVGSAGFLLKWAQNTSSANATRRYAGSALRYRRIV